MQGTADARAANEQRIATSVLDVGSVAVPVSDQDRAVRFYVETLGFEVRLDAPTGNGGRWVQVAAPGGAVAISLVAAPDASAVGVDSGITLVTADAAADHAALTVRGVDVDELLRWPGVPVMFAFRDRDGNQLKMMEAS